MAEEKLELRGIDWQETFSFTHVFRSFRLAIHPSKLVLAFVGLALCVIAGFVLDGLWYGGPAIIWEDGQPKEIEVFADKGTSSKDFPTWYKAQAKSREDRLKTLRRKELGLDVDEVSVYSASLAGKLIAVKNEKLQEWLEDNGLDNTRRKLKERYEGQPELLDERWRQAKQEVPKKLLARRREVHIEIESIKDLVGKGPARRGPFRALLRYELGVFDKVVACALGPNLLGGLEMTASEADAGVAVHLWRGLKGLQWLFKQHWVYFIVFGAFCLVVWSVFGGAITRTAALHVARGEKISIKEALKFGLKKFPSFLFAPLIPVAIVVVLVVVVLLGSFALGNWGWGIGEVLVSVLMFLPLIAGFVMALVAVGTVGGLNLMYPTIAVEGSDSFDAISRSFSYVYARPWRMAFYSLVALIYGVLCYLFVRFFAFLVLKMTHMSVGALIFRPGAGSYGLTNKFTSMWPAPELFGSLHKFDWAACQGAQTFGAFVIFLWVCVIIGFVAAFLVSFFFSANTVIYYLLRNRVDSTDMDDVYVEEEPEEQTPPVAQEPAEGGEAEKPKAKKPKPEEKADEPPEQEESSEGE
ncbi:MAG: hypothetical protein KAT11_00735 [Phycisphaerae bacterium]|nr:hypothetical protein [Phycisphaerae bacterium]